MPSTSSFTQFVQTMVATIQGRANVLLDTTVGSAIRATLESVAAQLMWLQAQFLSVLARTRASTSTGTDLDSWMADYGLTRLPATCATGNVTVARYTATLPATLATTGVILNGQVTGTAAFSTQDGTIQYAILPDTTNSYYNATTGMYTLPGSTASIPVLVGCLTAGTAGNAAAGAINTLATALPGIDTVTNGNAFTDAVDVETDSAFRVRFQLYLAGLSKATLTAITEAVESVQNGVTCDVVGNLDYATNNPRAGYFYVVVDDGSGAPGSTFLTTVYNAVDAVKALGVQFEVQGPTLLTANVAMTLVIAAGYDATATQTAVQAALTAYIGALPLGAGLPYSILASIAYNTSPGVLNVTGVSLNSSTSDLSGDPRQSIKPGTITVS